MTLKDLWNKLDVISVLGFLIAIETQISNGSMSLAHTLPDAWLPIVKEQAANLASIGGALVGIIRMAGNSSQSSTMSTVVKILVAGIVLSFLLGSSPASAQTRLKPLTGDLQKDFQAATTPDKPKLITGNAEKDMHALWDKLVAASNADLKYASALAGVANTPASAVRKQCYDAILALNTQVNGMNLKDAQGNPLPQPDPKLFTGVEQAAETIDNLSPSGPLFVACAGMAQLTKTNVLTLINAIVTGAAAFAVMPMIPGL